MTTVDVSIPLSFLLRLEEPLGLPYDNVCAAPPVPELQGVTVDISPAWSKEVIDYSGLTHIRASLEIRVESPQPLSDDGINRFAIRDCLEVTNRIINAYQAATSEVSNAGYISPLGISDIQLFANIRVDGQDFRDRWPFHDMSTIPLSSQESGLFDGYLRGRIPLDLPRLFLTSAVVLLNRGQYSLSVAQAAAAVELHLTQHVAGRLRQASWPRIVIREYEDQTLGRKLRFKKGDGRSLQTYLSDSGLLKRLNDPLNRLRNGVIHRGYLATLDEAREVVNVARRFLTALS